jgi:hypothetical protein
VGHFEFFSAAVASFSRKGHFVVRLIPHPALEDNTAPIAIAKLHPRFWIYGSVEMQDHKNDSP